MTGGPGVIAQVALLAVVEVSLSVDNAVVNATVLRRLSPFWQRLFLTVGVLVAVLGMRLLFPLLVVGVSARISPAHALSLALSNPAEYNLRLQAARPQIAAFGGVFLLMVFLDFALADRDVHWLSVLERAFARVGRVDRAAPLIALAALVAVAGLGTHRDGEEFDVLVAGVLGMIVYLLVSGLNGIAEPDEADEADDTDETGDLSASSGPLALTGRAAFAAFCFLELMDASFSFDSVIGAFAFTSNLWIIAVGLGIGALAVRSMTVRLVRHGTLARFAYLEHGAHYAIGALGTLLLVTAYHELPDLVTGLVGVSFIAAALATSVLRDQPKPPG